MAPEDNFSLHEPINNGTDAAAGIGQRIRAVLDLVPSRNEAAAIAGVSTQQLRNLVAERNEPSLVSMARLTEHVGVRLEWVVTGTGPMMTASSCSGAAPLDGELVGRMLEALRGVYREECVAMSDLELGRITAEECNACQGATVAEWPALVKAAALRHRNRLRTEDMGRREASG